MAKNRKTILINHRFFDGVENRLHEGQALVINDGRIEAAVPQTELPRYSEYAVVDLKGLTLLPGDIIATGTPSGVGFARTPPEYLQPGDVVECEVEGLGCLRNRMVLPG